MALPYFNASELGEPSRQYVAWIDVMGIQSHMSYSVKVAANFVFKLHIAALQTPRGDAKLYPVMDGLYVACADLGVMQVFVASMFRKLATLFRNEVNPRFRFIVRGAIARGPVYHGCDVKKDASETLAAHPEYRSQVLLGVPMVDAHRTEGAAAPFGIAIHPSAFRDEGGKTDGFEPQAWWPWFTSPTVAPMREQLASHYDWCLKNWVELGYRFERINVHRAMWEKYFTVATPLPPKPVS